MAAEGSRVVAIGDVHGDLDGLVEMLQAAGLVDRYARWSGGDATLVQTGDFLDRGAHVREVMELLMRLQQEAPRSGGRVVVLLGNHEGMNLLGVLRDVSPKAFASFVTPDSEKRRRQSWSGFVRWSRDAALRRGLPEPVLGPLQRAEFERQFPLGYFEYGDAMGPTGRYGRWLRTLPVVSRQGGGVFLHGGISPGYAGWTIDGINEAAHAEIAALDGCRAHLRGAGITHEALDINDRTNAARSELAALERRLAERPSSRSELMPAIEILRPCVGYESWHLIAEDGPLWFRGLARWSEDEGLRALPPLLESLGGSYFVAGHTPQSTGRIRRRFGGLAYLIDTGMLRSVYRGTPSALEITNGRFFAVYPEFREELGGQELLPTATSAAAVLPSAPR